MRSNITYTTEEIAAFYSRNRRHYSDYYPSEQFIINMIASLKSGELGHVLDVGCACGGLYEALCEQYQLSSYTGVDINRQAIRCANAIIPSTSPVSFISEDILHLDFDKQFDLVFSLSCADWNIQTSEIIQKCWELVAEDGYLIISLRTTPEAGVNDIHRSFQEIRLTEEERVEYEQANYVVLNFTEVINMFCKLDPNPFILHGYGYWGNPSPTAHTPYNKLLFIVFALHKKKDQKHTTPVLNLIIPADAIG